MSIVGDTIWMASVGGFVLGVTAWAVIDPVEAWPLTNAPMFAADVGADTAIYEVRLELEDAAGARRPFPVDELGISEWIFMRLLLTSAYGGMDHDAPHGFDDDTPERFVARLDRFFDACVGRLADRKKLGSARVVHLALERTRPSRLVREVGAYDVAERRFVHVWRAE